MSQMPLIALVGRPNVGKSTLFNRLTRSRRALVHDMPGVTRDRHYGTGECRQGPFRLVDTGGFNTDPREPFAAAIREQTLLAIEEADVIVLVVDARSGPTVEDWAIVDQLRRSGKPVICAANKAESGARALTTSSLFELGITPMLPVSAAHGQGIDELMQEVWRCLPPSPPVVTPVFDPDADTGGDEVPFAEPEPGYAAHVAFIGRPNVGKSSLVNRLLGEERMLVSDVPGTTRDSIDTLLVTKSGDRFLLVDTAGIRRKNRIAMRVEAFSIVVAMKALERADVALLVIDATEGVGDQEQRIANLATDVYKPLAFVVNKWDRLTREQADPRAFTESLHRSFPRLTHAPVLFVSAHTGKRTERILHTVRQLWQSTQQRLSTSQLNRWLEEVTTQHPPPRVGHGNRPLKLRYMSQVSINPPTMVVFANLADDVPESYRRYLENQLRARFGFDGVPVRFWFRSRENPYLQQT